MALEVGNQDAASGMSKAIYDRIRDVMEPDLGELSEDDLGAMQASWKKLAYAIARGVIEHITANMEIRGVQTRGNISAPVSGNTGPAAPSNHQHAVNLSGTQNNVTFTQNNDGTGLVF
jgi:hypothetical protein